MNANKLVVIVFAAFLFQSCASYKNLQSDLNPNNITEIAYFKPYSTIGIINKGNRIQYNDSLSQVSSSLIKELLDKSTKKLRISHQIKVQDSITNRRIEEDFVKIHKYIVENKTLDGLMLPENLDELLESRGVHFALIIDNTGFIRGKGNYTGQVFKAIGIGLLTLGMYIPQPIKESSKVQAMIVDSKADKVIFFNLNYMKDESPIEKEVLDHQLYKIFEGYLFPSK